MAVCKLGLLALLFFPVFCWGSLLTQNLPFDLKELQTIMTDRLPCTDLESAKFCRQLPWIPRQGEGVYAIKSTVVVLINESLPRDSSIKPLIDNYVGKQKNEIYSILFVTEMDFINAVNFSSFSSVFIGVLSSVQGKLKLISGFLVPRNAILNSLGAAGAEWRKKNTEATYWEIPESFQKVYQFESF